MIVLAAGLIGKHDNLYIAADFNDHDMIIDRTMIRLQKKIFDYYLTKYKRRMIAIRFKKVTDGVKYIVYKTPKARVVYD